MNVVRCEEPRGTFGRMPEIGTAPSGRRGGMTKSPPVLGGMSICLGFEAGGSVSGMFMASLITTAAYAIQL